MVYPLDPLELHPTFPTQRLQARSLLWLLGQKAKDLEGDLAISDSAKWDSFKETKRYF